MDDKLRKMLGLLAGTGTGDLDLDTAPAPAPAPTIEGDVGDVSEPAVAAPPSPTALQLDDWGKQRGQRLLADAPALQKMLHLGDGDVREECVADFFGAAFEPRPEVVESCTNKDRHQFVKSLLETPDYAALHADTLLDSTASEIAAVAFANQFSKLMTVREKKRQEEKERHEKEDKERKKHKKGGSDKGDGPGGSDKGDGPGGPGGAAGDKLKEEMEAAGAAAEACKKALGDVESHKNASEACGMGPGGPAHASPEKIAKFFARVKNNDKLRRIFDLAGKFRRLARSKQRQKMAHGYDDLVGVRLGDDIPRLMPHELAMLGHPILKLDAYRRLAEKQMMCFDVQTVEPCGAGPVIVCIDQSGSMGGSKGEAAMAVALAMAWIARSQKRWCALLAYTGQDSRWRRLSGPESPNHRLLVLPQGRWNEMHMIDWLDHFLGNGSHIDVPVRELPDFYQQIGAPAGKTDVLFITDAICHLDPGIVSNFNTWKTSAKARLISFIIGARGRDSRSLAEVSDELFCMPSLELDEEGISKVLSI